MINRWQHATWLVAALALAGCGGGGGGGGSGSSSSGGGGSPRYPLTITVSQNPFTHSVPQIDLPSAVTIGATVRGTTSATTLYVVVVDSAATFGSAISVSQTGTMEYQATLSLADTLSMGQHSGNLQISICSDPNCGNVLGRTTAPYVVTVAENPVLVGSLSIASASMAAVRGDDPVTWPFTLTTPLTTYIPRARFTDTANVVRLAGSSQTVSAPWGTTDLELTVSPDVAAGTYSGTLEIVYCRDTACTKMYRGVTRLPYTVTVYPGTNLKTLAPLAGATDWHTVQGSSAHTGHVPTTLNPANFSPRWLWRSPDPVNLPDVLEPVTAGGKVFTIAAPNPTINLTPVLYAIDEGTGGITWQQPIPDPTTGPSVFGLGELMPPAIAGNNVYVARSVNRSPPQQGRIFAFGVATGAATFAPQNFTEVPGKFGDYFYQRSSALIFIRPGYLTPRAGTLVLTGSVDFDDLQVALDQATGARTTPWPACASWPAQTRFAGTMAVDANGASFVATNSGLVLADSCETIASPVSLSDGFGPAIVPGTSDVIAVSGGSVVNFDTAARQVRWSAVRSDSDNYVGSPAVADGTVFVQNNSRVRLEARRATTGEVLWSWQPPWSNDHAFIGNVVATNNLVFVSTRLRTYAIDRTTRQAVWMYPYAGKLAISANGVLYVRRGNTWTGDRLAAINLQ